MIFLVALMFAAAEAQEHGVDVGGVPTNVSASTPLGDFGPTLFVIFGAIAFVGAVFVISAKFKGDLKEGMWDFVKSEDFRDWNKKQIGEHSESQTNKLLSQMEKTTDAMQHLSGEVKKLVERLDKQSDKFDAQAAKLADLERQIMQAQLHNRREE